MRRVLALVLVMLVAGTGAVSGNPKHKAASRVNQEDDMREAVFRYQIQLLVPHAERQRTIYFLAFAEKNPPSAFMKRFQGQTLTVKRFSEAQLRNGGINDKGGLILSIWSVNWNTRNEASVVAHHNFGDNQEDTYTYDLARKNGKWKVTGYWGDFS